MKLHEMMKTVGGDADVHKFLLGLEARVKTTVEKFELKPVFRATDKKMMLADGELWSFAQVDFSLTSAHGWGNENEEDHLPAELRFRGAKKAVNSMLADLVKAGFYVYVPEASKYNQYTGQLQIALMNIKAAASSKEELEAQLKDAWRSVASSAGTSGPKERPALGFLISVVKRPA